MLKKIQINPNQECEDELTQKGEMVSRLQTKASQIGNILQSLERKYDSKLEHHQSHAAADKSPGTRRQQNLQKFEALSKKHKYDTGPPMKRLHLKADAIPPFNPNLYRKSPCGPPQENTEIVPPSNEDLKTPTSSTLPVVTSLNQDESSFETVLADILSKPDHILSEEK